MSVRGRLAGGAVLALLLIAGFWAATSGAGRSPDVAGTSLVEAPAPEEEGPLLGASPDLEALEGTGRQQAAGGDGRGLFVRLPGPGRLSGRVLVRGGGAGLGGAEVKLTTFPPAGDEVARHAAQFLGMDSDLVRRVAPVASVETGPDGSFAFDGVAEGRWYLSAQSAHHVQDAPASARVVASGSGGPVTVWMRAGGRVVGRVTDADGQPVQDADVALATDSLTVLEAAADGELAFLKTTTDAQGAFAFPGVAPGEGYEVAGIGSGIAIVHVNDVAVRAGEDTFVELQGRRGATIRGRVVSAAVGSVDGGLEGAAVAAPLPGAQVAALPRGLRHLKLAKELLVKTHAVTDADGLYELRHVPPGTSDLLAMAEGHVPGRGPALRIGAAAPDAALEAPDFPLTRGPQLAGVVVDEGGAPLEGVRILWSVIDVAMVQGEPSLAPVFAAGMKDFTFPTTGPDGSFVAGPFAGRSPFQVRAVKTGYGVGEVEWSGRGAAAERAPLRIVLRRGGVLSGTVIDGSSGEPVPLFTASISGRIEADDQGPSRFHPFAPGAEFEGVDGRFELTNVVSGPQTLRIQSPGYVEQRLEVTVPGADAAAEPVEVRLEPGATVRGVIVDGVGVGVAGAQVTTKRQVLSSFERLEAGRQSIEMALAIKGRPPQGRTPPVGLLRHLVALGFLTDGVVQSGADGAFELTGLKPGSVELLAFHRDYRAGAALATLDGGADNDPVTIVLTSGGGLRGKVTDRFGQPVSGAMVLAVSPGLTGGPTANGEFHQARSGSDGSYGMQNLEGGSYLVVATRGDENLSLMGFFGTLNFDLVSVPAERVVTHNLVDTSANACRVTGVVTRAGTPVSGGVLMAVNLESEGLLGLDLKAAAIEGDGRYGFEGLVEGEYEVTFEGDGPRAQFLLDVPDAPALVHDVALPEGIVRGRLVAGESGAPVQGARLRLVPRGSDGLSGGGSLGGALSRGLARELFGARGGRGIVSTGGSGRFRFRGLQDRTYGLRLELSSSTLDFAPFPERVIELGEGEVLDLGDIVLAPGLVLGGTVASGDGDPIASARVVAGRATGGAPVSVLTNGDGRFRLRGLGPGVWEIRAIKAGFAPGEVLRLEIEDEAPLDGLELTLRRGVDVTAVVVDGTGMPRAGVSCVLVPEGTKPAGAGTGSGFPGGGSLLAGFFTGSNTTDERGERPLGIHGPGAYVLRASQGFASSERRVELRAGSPGRIEITLE